MVSTQRRVWTLAAELCRVKQLGHGGLLPYGVLPRPGFPLASGMQNGKACPYGLQPDGGAVAQSFSSACLARARDSLAPVWRSRAGKWMGLAQPTLQGSMLDKAHAGKLQSRRPSILAL